MGAAVTQERQAGTFAHLPLHTQRAEHWPLPSLSRRETLKTRSQN